MLKVILHALKQWYAKHLTQIQEETMQKMQTGNQRAYAENVSQMQGREFPSEEAIQKVIQAYQEEIKDSEQISKRTRHSVQSVDKNQVRKKRASKVRDLHSTKTSKGDAKRTLRKPSTQSNKVGRRKLPPTVRGL